jgi:hypothetical protein
MKLSRWFFVLVLCTSSLAVADREIDKKDFSGWMKAYDSLVYDEQRNAYLFYNEAKRGQYQRVLLDSVTV